MSLDWIPNPSNPALASAIPGDLKTTSGGRRLKELGRYCRKCEKVTYIKADVVGVCYEHQMSAYPCPECENSYYGESVRPKRGWIYTPICEHSGFNPRDAFLPQWHKTPSLQNEKYIR